MKMHEKKVLVLSGSNGLDSKSKQLAAYVAHRIENHETKLIDWRSYDIPVLKEDRAKAGEFPMGIRMLHRVIAEYEALIISVNERNLGISGFFKNIIDWLSAFDPKFLDQKKILLMGTSNNEQGASHALKYMETILPTFGTQVVESFGIPLFSTKFDSDKNEVVDEVVLLGLIDVISDFVQVLEEEQ